MDENNTKKVTINFDLIEAYKIALKEFKDLLNQMNEMWYGVIRLIITLSTSILLVSISLIDKIFPLEKAPLFIKNILVLGWILLFLSVIFGIMTELKGAELHGKEAKKYEGVLKNYLQQMTKGQFSQQEVDLKEGFIGYGSLFYGLSEIVTFIFAVLCLSIYFIGNIYSFTIWFAIAILIMVTLIVTGLILVYFKNR